MEDPRLQKLIDEIEKLTQPTTYRYLNQRKVADNSFYLNFEIKYGEQFSNITVVLDLFQNDCKLFILGALDFNLWYHLETVCADLIIIQSKLNTQYP